MQVPCRPRHSFCDRDRLGSERRKGSAWLQSSAQARVGQWRRRQTGKVPSTLINELKESDNYNEFGERCEKFGVFINIHTLEVDLFHDGFGPAIIETLREGTFGDEREGWIDEWEAHPDKLDVQKFLSLIEAIRKAIRRASSRVLMALNPQPTLGVQ